MPLATATSRSQTTVTWPWVYLSVSAIGFALLGLKWVGVPPVDDVSGFVLATIILGAFTGVSLLYWWDVNYR